MLTRIAAWLTPVSLSLPVFLPAPVSGLQESELEVFVMEQASAVERLAASETVSRSWSLRSRAAALGPEVDAVLDRILAERDALTPKAMLLLSSARLQGTIEDVEVLSDLLVPLVERGEPDVAEAAAGLLSHDSFRGLDRRGYEDVLERLRSVSKDDIRSLSLRLRCALTIHDIGPAPDRRQVLRQLQSLLQAVDEPDQPLVALALARIGEAVEDEIADQLALLAATPSPEGQLARLYLDQHDALAREHQKNEALRNSLRKRRLPVELENIQRVMWLIEKHHLDGDKYTREELMGAALQGMLSALDQHSGYMDPEAYGEFHQQMLEPVYGGIGAYINEDPVDGLITVARPIYSGPAYKQGLETDDKIVRVEDWPTLGHTTDEVVKRLKGRPGTKVRIYIWKRGMDPSLIERPTEEMAVDVVRAQVTIPSVTLEMLPGGVGLIDLQDFNRMASAEVADGIALLQQQGLKALILDLRRNLGGLLTEARNVTDLFLPAGKLVVTTEMRDHRILDELHTLEPAAIPDDMPLVILISRFSASASEIVAGALQDHGRALIVGERSFGKGAVQTVLPIPGNKDDEFVDENENGMYDTWEKIVKDYDGDGEFDFAPRTKITYARYVLPSGRSIHRELDLDRNIIWSGGVEPDFEVRSGVVDAWRLQERYRIFREFLPRQYVTRHWGEHEDLFRELATTDGKDASRYPDFDEFQASLNTILPRDDVRQILRLEIRRRVQDERKAEFPRDFQEDLQIQEAIRVALEAAGSDPQEIDIYRAVFEAGAPEPSLVAAADLLSESRRGNLQTASLLLRQAREGSGYVSRELLDRVLRLLAAEEEREDL